MGALLIMPPQLTTHAQRDGDDVTVSIQLTDQDRADLMNIGRRDLVLRLSRSNALSLALSLIWMATLDKRVELSD